ncbi:hypothetical protein D3C71_73070 [compost metagenome]
MKYIMFVFFLLFFCLGIIVQAQIPLTSTTWNGYADAYPHGNFAAVPTGSGVLFSQWRRYNNSTYQSATDGYNSENLNGNPVGYIAACIKTDPNTSLNLTQVSIIARRSTTGPAYFRAYLYTPSTGVLSLMGVGYLNSTNNETITFPVNYCIAANDSVELRLVMGGATNAGGTFRVVNGTSVSGTTNALCNVQSVIITPPVTVCIGDNAVISLATAPGTSIVYNVNNQNILGQLILDTVTTNSSGNAAITLNNVTGDSTVKIISAFKNPCCAVNIVQEIFITPHPVDTPLFTQLGPYCSGSAITLPATSNNGITGTWSPAINNTATTTYTFTPAAGQCAIGGQPMTIQISPALTGTETVTICYGQSYTFNGITYTTNNNTATDTFPGAGGCDSIVTLNLTVLNQAQPLVVNLEACEQLSYNNQVYTQSTVLHDTLHSVLGCDSIYRETRIVIHNNNATLVQIDTAGCDAVWLKDVRYTASAVVTDTFYNVLGCDSLYQQYNITVNRFYIQYTLEPEEPYTGEPFVIKIKDESDEEFEVLAWYPEDLFVSHVATQQSLSLSQDQEIKVLARSQAGCDDSVLIPVRLKAYSKDVIVPNAFTPNGDGRNDVFVPKLSLDRAYSTSEFRVYNRYGQVVHSTANMNSGWDGTSNVNGKPMEQGIYFYSISIIFLDGTAKRFTGELTLIR